ncbi:hypothetical protein TNCV_3157121 [Trichonephila clavipes]|nr:hypothetical protein TNCV_3157121 [Trichonephila clavipes]
MANNQSVRRHLDAFTRGRIIGKLEEGRSVTRVAAEFRIAHNESRFSLSSDSHGILIWRERGSRNHPSNIIERDRYGGRGVLAWGGIMLGSRTDLQIFDAGSVNGIVTRFFFHMCVFLEALWVCSSFSWMTMHHVIAQ